MGRRTHRPDIAPRHRHDSRREVRMAAKAMRPVPFGVRRPLIDASQSPLIKLFNDYWRDGSIHEDINPRQSLHVTEMPINRIDAQLTRGIVIGYEFARRAQKHKDSFKEVTKDTIDILLGSADIFKNRNFGFRVISEALEEEHYGVKELMGRLGIKGAMRDTTPLHVTCGSIDDSSRLRKSEKMHVIDVMNEMLEDVSEGRVAAAGLVLSRLVTLDELDFYEGKHS